MFIMCSHIYFTKDIVIMKQIYLYCYTEINQNLIMNFNTKKFINSQLQTYITYRIIHTFLNLTVLILNCRLLTLQICLIYI